MKIKAKPKFRFSSNFNKNKLLLTNNWNKIRKIQALEAELLQYKALVAANEQPLMSCSKNVKRKRKNPEVIDSKSLPLPEKHSKKIVTDVEQEATITEIWWKKRLMQKSDNDVKFGLRSWIGNWRKIFWNMNDFLTFCCQSENIIKDTNSS